LSHPDASCAILCDVFRADFAIDAESRDGQSSGVPVLDELPGVHQTVAVSPTESPASSRASKISADGSTIVGWYGGQIFDRRPTRWTNGGDPDLFLGDVLGEATAATSDGSVIVGGAIPPDGSFGQAFVYSDDSGGTSLGVLDHLQSYIKRLGKADLHRLIDTL
jgi:hypothetical protein